MSLRNLQRRVAKIEKSRKPKLSPFAIIYGSFDAWVDRDILPALEAGTLDREFIVIVAALRRWEGDGTWQGAYAG